MEFHCFTQQLLEGVAHSLLQIKIFLFFSGWGIEARGHSIRTLLPFLSTSPCLTAMPCSRNSWHNALYLFLNALRSQQPYCGHESPYSALLLTSRPMTSACTCFPGGITSECSYFGMGLDVFLCKYLYLYVQRWKSEGEGVEDGLV